MEKRFKGVLFDLDGTLIDTCGLILASMRHAVTQVLGCDASDEALMAQVGTPLYGQMLLLADDDEAVADELTRVYREFNWRMHDELIREYPGVREMLGHLQAAGVPMGVVTSKTHELAMRGVRACGLEGFLDFLVGPDDFPLCKPNPGPVLEGCRRMGLEPSICLYVGDSPFDIRAGNAAGCATAAVSWGVFALDVLEAERPTHVVRSAEGLAGLVLEI